MVLQILLRDALTGQLDADDALGVPILFVLVAGATYRIQLLDDHFRVKFFLFTLLSIRYSDTTALVSSSVFMPLWFVVGFYKKGRATAAYFLRLHRELDFFREVHERNQNCRLDSRISAKLRAKAKRSGRRE